MESEIVSSLRLFNEKAEKLLSTQFTYQLPGSKLTVKTFRGGKEIINRAGPSGFSFDEFILTYRFFIQDNERISFANIASCYSNPSIQKKLQDSFNSGRKILNDFLNGYALVEFEGKRFTRRELQEIFIYGGYAHANQDKKELYDKLMEIPIIKAFCENEFVYILGIILRIIKDVKVINEEAIDHLTKNNKTI